MNIDKSKYKVNTISYKDKILEYTCVLCNTVGEKYRVFYRDQDDEKLVYCEEHKKKDSIDMRDKVVKFVKRKDGTMALMGIVLTDLLDERKRCKRLMAEEKDDFERDVLNGKQLALKITANSMYGGTGAEISPFVCRDIAASTTADGRNHIIKAKRFIEEDIKRIMLARHDRKKFMTEIHETFKCIKKEEKFIQKGNNKDYGDNNLAALVNNSSWNNRQEFYDFVFDATNKYCKTYEVNPRVVYGDTDSVFFDMGLNFEKDCPEDVMLDCCIGLAMIVGFSICTFLYELKMEYENDLAFCSICKKEIHRSLLHR